MDNRVVLGGELSAVEALRHTPAGVPLMSFSIAHRSTQTEAGIGRRVECEVPGLALGAAALALSAQRPGAKVRVSGFLTQRGRASRQLVVHVNEVELL